MQNQLQKLKREQALLKSEYKAAERGEEEAKNAAPTPDIERAIMESPLVAAAHTAVEFDVVSEFWTGKKAA